MMKATVEKIILNQENRGKRFAKSLLQWNNSDNDRQMPWKGEKDPYKIWLSEVILQQTRVEQGLKYYQNFILTYPDVHALADADEAAVFKLWEGLGYYSRCRNLIQTAKFISRERNGVFPCSYEEILALKGVGAYTAAAISSFAFKLPYAVLDGNVFRVLSRIYDEDIPIDTTKGKKLFSRLAEEILPVEQPGEFNQAIMDFGAVVCKPVPSCHQCFFTRHCLAFQHGTQHILPVKEKKTKVKKRWLNYFIVQHAQKVVIQQRNEKDIWQSLHQFLLVETDKALTRKSLENVFKKQYGIQDYSVESDWTTKQQLSHQTIYFHFLLVKISSKKNFEDFEWVAIPQLKKFAFPRTLQQAIQLLLI